MTQRIFDIENKEDMADLWDILPEETAELKGGNNQPSYLFGSDNKAFDSISQNVIKINWHDKTEITRPVKYEDMIGCVGWFSDNIDDKKAHLGILKAVSEDGFKYKGEFHDWWFEYFTPVKKSEVKFSGEQDD